jgi:flagellar basal body-associated protein FliL
MSKEMKVIMENWDKFLLEENVDTSVPSKVIVSMFDFDEIEKNVKDEINDEQDLNEVIATGIAVSIFIKLIGGLGLGSLIFKFANWMKKIFTGTESQVFKKWEDGLEEATKTLGTLGMNRIVKHLIDAKVADPNQANEYKEKVDLISGLIVFIICSGAAANEIYKGAEAAGGLSNFFKELAQKAGITDSSAIQSLYELFDSTLDVGEGSFDTIKYIKNALAWLKNYLQGTP